MDNEKYDVVICGTGITESILSGLLSLEGLKVLHIDRNQYYGDEGASVNLTTLFEKFGSNSKPPEELGHNRDWNIDLLPKFVMVGGNLVKMLLKTQVSKYMNWKKIDSCYVYQYNKGGFFSKEGGKIEKIPGTEGEALKSSLMSLLEKRRFAKLLGYVNKTDFEVQHIYKEKDLNKISFKEFCEFFSLNENTIDFLIHGVALYTNDETLKKPAIITLKRIKVYLNSIHVHGNTPFVYPFYGLSMIPEGFARKCAVYGGTFMLDQTIDKIHLEDGKVFKVTHGEDKTAFCKMVIANPSYMLDCNQKDKIKKIGTVIRRICILDHPVTKNKDDSFQIIIPQKQTGRSNDIYIMMVNSTFNICKKNYYIAIISTKAETNDHEKELEIAYKLIGKYLYKFDLESEMYEPVDNSFPDNVFITKTLDPTSHYSSVSENVLEIYKKITGKELNLKDIKDDDD